MNLKKFKMKTGIEIIVDERNRQLVEEKFDATRDANYTKGELACAAACYAMTIEEREKYQSYSFSEPRIWFPRWWPKSWDIKWWKPTPENRIKELAKAGALIAAEIDRINIIKK